MLPTAGQAASLSPTTAGKFADLALACVHREYPVKIAHSLNSAKDVQAPRDLNPAFYGCYDWHSSVHGHWMLARLARLFPDEPFAALAKQALAQSLTPANLAREADYLRAEGRESFERPYGLAWLLQLAAELRQWDDGDARHWSQAIRPLEDAAVQRLQTWLPKLTRPVRSGEHSNTAFSVGLLLDYAHATNNTAFEQLLRARARDFYAGDAACPLTYEPSGEDFLSPCLAEADVMRRVLPSAEFAPWLARFLPVINLRPGIVTDPSDGKLAHLDGLNLSRAWMLNAIAAALAADDPRRKILRATAEEHATDGLRAVTGAHYEGGHWLGTFAVYLLTH